MDVISRMQEWVQHLDNEGCLFLFVATGAILLICVVWAIAQARRARKLQSELKKLQSELNRIGKEVADLCLIVKGILGILPPDRRGVLRNAMLELYNLVKQYIPQDRQEKGCV